MNPRNQVITLRWASVAVALGLAAASVRPARGGDAIIFSNTKATSDAGPDKKLSQDSLRSREGFSSSKAYLDPLTSPMIPGLVPPRDKKQEKRDKIERVEKKNWMMVNQGELQQKEEEKEAFGVRSYDVEDIEKSKGKEDFFFKKDAADDKKSGGTYQLSTRLTPSSNRLPSQTQRPLPTAARTDDEIDGAASRGRREAGPELGAHTSKQLDLSKLYEPQQSGIGSRFLTRPDLFGGVFDNRSSTMTPSSRNLGSALDSYGASSAPPSRDPLMDGPSASARAGGASADGPDLSRLSGSGQKPSSLDFARPSSGYGNSFGSYPSPSTFNSPGLPQPGSPAWSPYDSSGSKPSQNSGLMGSSSSTRTTLTGTGFGK